MKIDKFLLSVAIPFAVASCDTKRATTEAEQSYGVERIIPREVNNIVLIFSRNDQANSNKKSSFYTANNVRYYENVIDRIDVELQNKEQEDTIVVITDRKLQSVDLFHNYVTFNYYFQKGDTAVFSFRDDIPYVQLINRETKTYDTNLSLVLRKRFNQPLKESGIMRLSADKATVAERFEIIKAKYQQEQGFLDSLQSNGLLTHSIWQVATQQQVYKLWEALLDPTLAPYRTDESVSFPLSELVNNDRLIFDDFFHRFLKYKYLWSDLMGIRKVRHSQGISLDYKEGYEKVKAKIGNHNVKNLLLFYCLQMIQDEEPKAIFNAYLKQFKVDVRDTAYIAYLDKNFNNKPNSPPGSSTLTNLFNTRKVEFNKLIDENKGRVIYVDLWASWCKPCLSVMPASHLLREQYKGEPIVFIYLSIDDKFTAWEKAAEKVGLVSSEDNFLLLNPRDAGLTKQISLRTLPRYLIFGKSGALLHENAPGPDSPELVKLLDRYIKE
ncbi:TlpA family protein disulfide reductase [Pontibacter sp. Tf4]|uniref:TlpA family protein disulfide reductase n=1 Tax=Pontibacter sp. Tf4 TaxID=2761620 RepID=UPI00162700B4|nr:TlpA disulfide reductase family protein [Pontibacter sp. Tf4]MBB6611764.1 TlpA family protein disulfide reductase [Pontibacter sp. Tf4]